MQLPLLARSAVVAASAALAACAHAPAPSKIVIDGSTGVMPLAVSLGKAFHERHPTATIEYGKGLGTKARLQALAEGKIDVALASHGLDFADLARQGMQAHEIARVAVVFGVNSTVTQVSLTEVQICDAYSGNLTDWSSFGHAALPLAARTRPDSEVDTEVVRAQVKCLGVLKMPATVKVMPRAGDMAQELAGTRGAIGMTTMTVVEQSQGKVRALAINGVAPTPANVERSVYTLVRQSYFVVKSPPSPAVARFVEYARSGAGHAVITANGALPVK